MIALRQKRVARHHVEVELVPFQVLKSSRGVRVLKKANSQLLSSELDAMSISRVRETFPIVRIMNSTVLIAGYLGY